MSKSWGASAPGSLMLMGEHAVLRGSPAIVCAIDHRIYTTLTVRSDKEITICSDRFGWCRVNLLEFNADIYPFHFILSALDHFRPHMVTGCDIAVKSGFSHQVGLGSSAAITVATITVLARWLRIRLTPIKLLRIAREVTVRAQGAGSGADTAASIFGGVVYYRPSPLKVEALPYQLPINVVYTGSKMLTKEVISMVDEASRKAPHLYKALFKLMGYCTNDAYRAIKEQDWIMLGHLFNIHQGLQDALGTSNEIISEIVYQLRKCPDIKGAKISGSGLGDSIIGLGSIPDHYFPTTNAQAVCGVKQIPVTISPKGILCYSPETI